MIIAVLIGFFLGFLISIPIGPITLTAINAALKNGFRSGIAVGFGAALMDTLYFAAGLFGFAHIKLSHEALRIIEFVGVAVLLILGIRELFSRPGGPPPKGSDREPRMGGYFALGVSLYLSNPTFLASYAALATLLKGLRLFPDTLWNDIATDLGLGAGVLSWFVLVLWLTDKYRCEMSGTLFTNIKRAAGILTIGYALFLGYTVIRHPNAEPRTIHLPAHGIHLPRMPHLPHLPHLHQHQATAPGIGRERL